MPGLPRASAVYQLNPNGLDCGKRRRHKPGRRRAAHLTVRWLSSRANTRDGDSGGRRASWHFGGAVKPPADRRGQFPRGRQQRPSERYCAISSALSNTSGRSDRRDNWCCRRAAPSRTAPGARGRSRSRPGVPAVPNSAVPAHAADGAPLISALEQTVEPAYLVLTCDQCIRCMLQAWRQSL